MTERLQYPTFSVDGWSGNARDADGVEWWVLDEVGWTDGPDVRLTQVDRPQHDGAFDARSFRSVRTISLEGIAVAPDTTSMWRAKERLAAVLADEKRLAEMVVTEPNRTRRVMVRLAAGCKVEETTPYSFEFALTVTAPDPVRYSVGEHRLRTGPPRRGEGLRFPLSFPLRIGEPSGGQLRPTNAGTVPTAPVWEITGPVEQPAIEQVGTGEQLAFDLTLTEEERLVVDVARRTVLLGGRASRRSAMRPGSRWFPLPPGRTDVRFAAWTFGASARLAVVWRDAWI